MTTINAFLDLLASAPLPGPVYHLNVARRYVREVLRGYPPRPGFGRAHIPACDGPGNSEWDFYTDEWDAVTCPGCKAEVERLRAEARETQERA